jgi:hypothetical protein
MIDDLISPAQVDTSRLEVLSEIFLHCMDEKHFQYLFRLNTTPLLLGSVCGKWRTIALAEVFLLHCEQWCDIHLSSAPAKNHLPNLQKLHLNLRLEETIDIFEFAP